MAVRPIFFSGSVVSFKNLPVGGAIGIALFMLAAQMFRSW
jgi:hypothetical protein